MKDKLAHFLASAKVGPKGQIVIPKEIRDMFGIESGDSLLIMADSERGIAIQKQSVMEDVAKAIFEGKAGSVLPKEDPEELVHFATAIKGASGKGRKAK
jgi:AbrB family looped-hinge helix DNA binding protein